MRNSAGTEALGELTVRADDGIEHSAEPAQVAPEPIEPAVDRRNRSNPAEPAIGISGERIGMHHQRTRGGALPATDHGRARPGRGGFDMIRAPRVQYPMKRPLIVKVTITSID